MSARLRFIFIILSLLLAISAWAKPLPPLSVELVPQGQPVAGASFSFELRIRSHLATDRLQLSLTLPEGVILQSGELEQTLTIAAHESLSLPFVVQLPQQLQGQIVAVCRIRQGAETRYAAGARLLLGQLKGKQDAPGMPSTRRQRDGQGVKEFVLP